MVESKTEIQAREAFERAVVGAEMRTIRDEGLHRHLHFRLPNHHSWFDLLTWPGQLCITGDMPDALVFARIQDMFDFFASDAGYRINPQYWAEKLLIPGRARAVETYAEDLYLAKVGEWIEEHAEEMEPEEEADFRREAERELLHVEVVGFEDTARDALHAFDHKGLRVYEPWEWNLKDWDFNYLWSCHAIIWGIEQYRAAAAPKAVAA